MRRALSSSNRDGSGPWVKVLALPLDWLGSAGVELCRGPVGCTRERPYSRVHRSLITSEPNQTKSKVVFEYSVRSRQKGGPSAKEILPVYCLEIEGLNSRNIRHPITYCPRYGQVLGVYGSDTGWTGHAASCTSKSTSCQVHDDRQGGRP